MSLNRSASTGFFSSSSADLSTPLLLATGIASTTQANVTSSTIAPPANSLLVCGYVNRHSGDQVIQTPSVSGLSLDGGWTIVQAALQDSGSTRYVRAGVLMAKMADVPGTGTITFTSAGDVWQQTYSIAYVAKGFGATPGSYPTITGSGELATLALNLAAPPASTSLLVSLLGHIGIVGNPFTPPAGMTQLAERVSGASAHQKVAYALTGGAQNNTWTDLDTDASVGIVVEITQA